MKTGLNEKQLEQLLKPVAAYRVKQVDGMSHLEAWDVRRFLIRIFGFGEWSAEVQDCQFVYEESTMTKSGKPAFKVGYRATVCLSIHATGARFTECAFGESIMPDFKRGACHDMAIKTAESQALKRCAVNLGDQFGLGLYNGGKTDAVVSGTLNVGIDQTVSDDVVVVEEIPMTAMINMAKQIESITDRDDLRAIWKQYANVIDVYFRLDDYDVCLRDLITERVGVLDADNDSDA